MRISDWSSDVCSSDLGGTDVVLVQRLRAMPAGRGVVEPVLLRVAVRAEHQHVREVAQQSEQALAIGIAERVASGRLEQRDVHAQYQQALLRYGRQVGLERKSTRLNSSH